MKCTKLGSLVICWKWYKQSSLGKTSATKHIDPNQVFFTNKIEGTPILKLKIVKRLCIKKFVKKLVKKNPLKNPSKESSVKKIPSKEICQKIVKKSVKKSIKKIRQKIR